MNTKKGALINIVTELLSKNKEGDYWDFKEKYGDNGSLIHDIICLANTITHNGDRYIIYGITDDFRIVGLDESKCKKQADIIDLLRNAHFSNIHPDIFLDTIYIENKRIDVLTIKDDDNKPYFLEKEYNKGKRLTPGTIYIRKRDSNTPNDSSASFYDIEKIWKHRFGIDLSGIERVKFLMKSPSDWEHIESIDGSYIYHKLFPEYRITYSESEERFGEAYICSYLDTTFNYFEADIYFYGTRLHRIPCVSCDGARTLIVCPESRLINNKHPIYFYKKNTIYYLLHRIMNPNGDTSCQELEGIPNEYIMLFNDDCELDCYLSYLYSRIDKLDLIEKYKSYDGEPCKTFEERVNFIKKCIFIYCEWKQKDFSKRYFFR